MNEPTKPPRTTKQNNSLWKWATMLAEELNDAGFDLKKFLEVAQYKIDVPWNKGSVVDVLWRPVQEAMTGKESTTELDTVDPAAIHKVVANRVAELTGVYVEWPSRFNRRLRNEAE